VRLIDGEVVYSSSDLNDYLACAQRIALGLRALARNEPVASDDPTLELIARKGQQHELAELARLEAAGVRVVRIDEGDASLRSFRRAVEATRAAMEAGAEAIYQGAFHDGAWAGRADFLIRVDHPSALGAWSYDIADAKLAVSEKASFLVQLCVYADLVAAVQGVLPRSIRALLGDGREVRYDPARYVAYVRLARERFERRIASLDPEAVPERVSACDGCAWFERCDERRRKVDHLSFVAGIRRAQIARLDGAGLTTLAALAQAPDAGKPARMSGPTFAALRKQAALQLDQRLTGIPRYELLEPRERTGFAALPEPARGDVYFDIEGDPLYEPGRTLEYLLGAYVHDAQGPRYRPFWGETRAGERVAFEAFVDWLSEHRRTHLGAHVYHYGPYDKIALRRLAMQHGTREDAVDDLLRGEVLVDLYHVVRGGLVQSHESYSIKKLERFYHFRRTAEIRRGDLSILAFEHYLVDRDPARRAALVAYNEEDCFSTRLLHEWLLHVRREAEAAFGVPVAARAEEPPRPQSPAALAEAEELDALQRALLERTADTAAHRRLAHLLAYHRREDKPVWWAYFDRLDREGAYDAVDEDTEALGGIELCAEVAPEPDPAAKRRGGNLIYTYRYPRQQHKLGKKPVDPVTRKSGGEVVSIDDEARQIRLKRNPAAPHPRTLIPGPPINTDEQKNALRRFARAVLDGSVHERYPAAWDLLRAQAPRIRGLLPGARVQPALRPGAEAIAAADVAALARELDRSTLVVQGPPGTGKTFTGAHVIADLLAQGKRVGVTSTGHHAIHNLLHAVEAVVTERGRAFRGVKKCTGPDSQYASRLAAPFVECRTENEAFGEFDLVAGTAWLFTRDDLAPLDVLVIDEAGQVALADALAMATSAASVVLLGDPLQLAQVSLAEHPEGAGASVLDHLLAAADRERGTATPSGADGTVPEDRGVFLDRSFRMHPELCEFISEMVYGGRLHAASSCERQRVDAAWFAGAGLRYVPVEHAGNAQSSPEEVEAVVEIVAGLVGGTFTARDGETRPLGLADILVVSPYNAQVALLKRALRARFGTDARVGTVDKFQGQEAPAVIYSLAASSAEDAPRGADFLLEENRFNVAVSRGRALAVLVCSPRILETRCTAVGQVRAVAAFCAFARHAEARLAEPVA
jgi:predicted RecB family nuclease